MENKVTKFYTLITGASAGIGEQLAILCAQKGFNLFLVSLPETGLEKLATEISQKYPVDIQILNIDLTAYDAPAKVFEFTREKNITVNILINNAGVGFDGKFDMLTPALIDHMILLNVRATTQLTFYFLPEMKKLDKAYILNISSFGSFVPLPYKCVYAATKTYILYFTRGLNSELKGTMVQATSVHPSGVSSERALEDIRQLSFLKKITALSPSQVAQISLNSMFAGKTFVIPGLPTKFYYLFGSCLPHGIVIRLVSTIFRKTS
jgi:uncharacterized protein